MNLDFRKNLHVRLTANHKIISPSEQAAQSGTHTAHASSHHATTMHNTESHYITENSEDDLLRSKHVAVKTIYYCYNYIHKKTIYAYSFIYTV